MIELTLINDDNLAAPKPNQFQVWVDLVSQQLGKAGELCIKIIDAEESQYLNRTYRNKDRPTNVLSFPSELPDFVDSAHLGDLAICVEVVASEAATQGKPLEHHWAHLTFHGLLHLLGFDHIEASDAQEMEALEIKLLSQLDIPNPY